MVTPVVRTSIGAKLDHLAIGVVQWADSYPRFVSELGGKWGYGGPNGDFAPYQLDFGEGLRLEFIAPHTPGGFMERFIERRGPSPHHFTFKVPSLDDTIADLTRLGFEIGGESREQPVWLEAFIHPKETGVGTLVQIVESDDQFIDSQASKMPAPQDFPEPSGHAQGIALVGVTTSDLGRAHDLLVRALLGDVLDNGDGWFLVSWGDHRSLLVRDHTVSPWAPPLWDTATGDGVAFVLFGSENQTAASLHESTQLLTRLPHEAATGIPVWLLEPNRTNSKSMPISLP